MRVAYLIQAHDNYKHLQRLIDALNDGNCAFYIHIDKKAAIPELKGNNIFFIQNRVNVHWAGFSQVKASLYLMQTAVKKSYDYYALISGADYPIKPIAYLYKLLETGGEYIDITKGYNRYAPKSRYSFYYFTDYYNRRNKKLTGTKIFMQLQQMLRKLRVRKAIPFQIYFGASWFVLSNTCIQYILDVVEKNKKLSSFFKFALSPDEAFFQTIIGNSHFLKHTKHLLTYTDWGVDPGPAIISKEHVALLKKEPYKFFARKFSDASTPVIELIEKEIRSSFLKRDVTA